MKPEEALYELSAQAKSHEPAGTETSPISGSVNRTYFLLRRWIAIIALALPLVLWIGDGPWPHPSISEYYHNPGAWMRDYLVGTLSAVGFFLYFYMGYSRSEDIALNCAAIGALIVAFFPMDWPTKCADPGALPEAIFSLHGIGAAVLFLSIAFVCVVKADDTLDLLTDEKLRAKFKRSYVVLGALMVAMPLSVFLVHLCLPKTECSRVVFFIELAGILIFAAYWLVKSREIHFIQHQN